MANRFRLIVIFLLANLPLGCAQAADPEWVVSSLPYRILVEVPAVKIHGRAADTRPASLEVDFTESRFGDLKLPGPVDLDSIQVIRYDPETGKALDAPSWPFRRSVGERASRFLDKSLPWEFPLLDGPSNSSGAARTFPRGAYLVNAKGKGNPGLLVWDHLQEGNGASYYAIYFDTLKKGQKPKPPRQGFVGDGSPRRDLETDALTGTLYNRVTVDDWDEDGLFDLIVGGGFGNILLFRNEGDNRNPRFAWGEYVLDSEGRILDAGGMASPAIADWNGDGKKDLVVGVENTNSVLWYENIGSNKDRKFVFRGYIQADGKNLVVPPKPCPETPHYKKDYAPAVEVVDWDGDGDLDLLLGGYITGYIWYYENTGAAADGTPRLSFRGPLEADGKPLDTIWGAHPCVADFDHDGDLDLLTGSFGQAMGGGDSFSQFLIYYENVGTRTLPKLVERPVQYEGKPPRDILAQARTADFDGDGLIDLAISTYSHIYLAKNVGSKNAPRWKVELQRASWGLAPLSATQLIDWNRDGHLDLIRSPLDGDEGSGAGAQSPKVALNQRKGTHGCFDAPKPLLPEGQGISHPAPYGDPWAFVYLYDFDQDGDHDLLWADGPGYAYLHRNNGTQQNPKFDTQGEKLTMLDGKPIKVGPPVVPLDQIKDFTMMQGSRAGIAAEDFNEDGKTDIAMGDTYGDVYYFENRGTNEKPLFAHALKLGNLSNRAIPLPYDWDGDGRIDLLGTAWSGQMQWYRNLGRGATPQFAGPEKFKLPPVVVYSPRLLIADWNGDGDDDFLIMSSYPWFCWLEGSYVRHGYAQGRLLSVQVK